MITEALLMAAAFFRSTRRSLGEVVGFGGTTFFTTSLGNASWNCWGLIFTNLEVCADNAGVIFIRVISGAEAVTGCNTAGKLDTKNSIDKNKQSWKSHLSSSNLFSDHDKSNSYPQNQSHTATPTAWKITSSSLSLISARPRGCSLHSQR